MGKSRGRKMENKEFKKLKEEMEKVVAGEKKRGTIQIAVISILLMRITEFAGDRDMERTYTETQLGELFALVEMGMPYFNERHGFR